MTGRLADAMTGAGGLAAAVLLGFAAPTPARAQAPAPHGPAPEAGADAPASLMSERRALGAAGIDYVDEAYPIDDGLRQRARGGQILPYCRMAYPETWSQVGDELHDLPAAERAAIVVAVDAAFVRQSLIAAGMDPGIAGLLGESYRGNRESFAQQSPAQQQALVQQGEDPPHNLLKAANLVGRLLGLPTFGEPESCGLISLPVLQPPTPYRFVPDPPGARVFVLRGFLFKLCEKRFADPFDRRSCKAWEAVPQGSARQIAGVYYYSVEWPDGDSQREHSTFAFLGSDQQDVRIAKPAP
jgi:hypothetical protein